ncbi:NF-kappa-B inhibitor-like protein 1 [Hydractinia symbiolongicarpus]|uniref:NF-kappa-B inhibitor-like protein 1 n=1 Tax=Hydractinia symbiolongicarpus TaxID=13093 RepID=UPI00254FE306|nr:NF-kappa-B inhibitor-like protein 1 [Hydractinia symbiolongicarpus]
MNLKNKQEIDIKRGIKKMRRYIKDGRVSKLEKIAKKFKNAGSQDDFVKEMNSIKHKKNYLHKCCVKGDVYMMETLIKLGADVSICDHNNNNILHLALNYILENLDRNFLGYVFDLLKLSSNEMLRQKNTYGETPEELLAETIKILEDKQNAYLIESESESDIGDDSWNERLFFEMGQDEKFSNETYAQDEFNDTNLKRKEETFSEWGDKMRESYHRKNSRHYVNENERKKKAETAHEDNHPDTSLVDELKKKFRIIELRERYETECARIFNHSENTDLLCFGDIPWPETMTNKVKAKTFLKYIDDMIDTLVHGLTDEDKLKYLKKQQIRWHPDRFLHRCGHRLNERDRSQILDAVNAFSQKINSTIETLK